MPCSPTCPVVHADSRDRHAETEKTVQTLALHMNCPCGMAQIPVRVTGKSGVARTKRCRVCGVRYDYSCWKIAERGARTFHKLEAFPVRENAS